MLCIVSKYHLQGRRENKKNWEKKQTKKRPVMLYHTTRCQHLFVHNGLVQALLSVV